MVRDAEVDPHAAAAVAEGGVPPGVHEGRGPAPACAAADAPHARERGVEAEVADLEREGGADDLAKMGPRVVQPPLRIIMCIDNY